ncbi:hypothetical protein NK718_19510, partial [Alsobacter sp. SYSU M60028]
GPVRVVEAGGARGDLLLPAGSRARHAGLAWPLQPAGEGDGVADVAARLAGGAAVAVPSGAAADRWERRPVHVVAGGALVSAELVAEGRAAVRPGDLTPACRATLLALEAEARRARRGAWAEGGVFWAAGDTGGLRARDGRFTVVEGRVASIGEAGGRFYLNFGAIRSETFSVSVARAALRRFEASGMRLTSLEGRRVRVRGVVLDRRGPAMEIASPDELERLD